MLLELLASPNICSRRPIYEQYDTEVGLVRVIGPGGDGGVARIPGTAKGIAVSTDCNSRYVYADPRRGSRIAVFESARNVAVTGALPIGITNNLNFANPYIPENYYMFSEAIAGMREACLALDVPVTGGNVSFYNESEDGPIYPTPTIGMVGLIEDVEKTVRPNFQNPGDVICLVGDFNPSLGVTEYLYRKHGLVQGQVPALDMRSETRLIGFLIRAASDRLLTSAKDLSLGGLAVALFKTAYNERERRSLGFTLSDHFVAGGIDAASRKDLFYFGETNSSVILSVPEGHMKLLRVLADEAEIHLTEMGVVTESPIYDYGLFQIEAPVAIERYEGGLANL
jgi:phosphoribosylformylglycinamidine synthase